MTSIPRLLETFKPQHYDLYLDINRQNKTIKGETKIQGQAKQADIALHQHDLVIESVQVAGQDLAFTMDNDKDLFYFTLPAAGESEITVKYHAPLTDNMNGIYPSYYQVDGQQKQLVSTQFETYFARQAFPGVDEPAAKATFSLAIKWDEQPGETVIANMPEEKVVDGVHYFQETVKMSTYLVAFALGDMQAKKAKTKSGVEVGVFATKAHPARDLDFALDIATRAIDFYEDYYQTPYPLPHSWQVALPDFSAGAMENWGIVTYREAYLLVDPDNTALAVKQTVATVITHELAHQWFGDLVTMKWWDELWLNESFANMMEFVAVDALEPDWHIWESFNAGDVQAALKRDAIKGVQPVHVEVQHPEEIDALFDPAIVYAKGARLLVMVRSLIGDNALRTGLKNYFAKMKYSNASGDDLWAALGEASGQDIGAIMKTWLEQGGYPIVKLQLEDGHLIASQEQFNIGPKDGKKRLWQVPLKANRADLPALLSEEKLDLGDYDEIKAAGQGAVRLNVGNAGHYIVKYDQELLADVLGDLDSMDAISQAQVLQDNLLQAQAGVISYADLIWLLPKLAEKRSALVNDLVYQIVAGLKNFVDPKSQAESWLKLVVNHLSEEQIARLGWDAEDSDTTDDRLIRPVVLSAGLYGENPLVLNPAHEKFEAVKGDVTKLPADGRTTILLNEIKNFNSDETFQTLWQAYRQTSNASLKNDLRTALTASPKEAQLKELVEHFQNADYIKPQDLRGWFAGVLKNPAGQELAWTWLRDQWSWLEEKLGGDMEFSSYVTVISRIFHTEARLREFKDFFADKIDQPGLSREITMDIDIIASRVAVESQQKSAVEAALAILAQ
ncbi:M1 family metallopeptidase [Eupransor demetentiae]|uniref:Aminopeptidase n=1 Tax=Eupransor demetentiae TaxID=3109584 RepID=A0ABM9N321_9LACO|nr:Aminopeptidase N [Lactobacillaceae bacterium LMG 33000]